jgi:hypothetical protein
MRSLLSAAAACLVLSLAASSASAQGTITRLVPDRGSPGDLVIIQGTGLAATIKVTFTASIGGTVGVQTVAGTIVSVTDTEVRTLVPGGFPFLPPGVMGSSPWGSISINTSSVPMPFFYNEGSGGMATTLGIGTTQSSGQGRAVISWNNGMLPPIAGAPNFKVLLQNAVPGATAFFAASGPGSMPYPMMGDGTLVLDLVSPLVIWPLIVDPAGDVTLDLPIPPTFSGTIAMQWAVIEPLSTTPLPVSNGVLLNIL